MNREPHDEPRSFSVHVRFAVHADRQRGAAACSGARRRRLRSGDDGLARSAHDPRPPRGGRDGRRERLRCRRVPGRTRPPACSTASAGTATDLRMSLTDRCNLRCTYCMPADGLPWLPKDQALSADEIVRLVRIGVARPRRPPGAVHRRRAAAARRPRRHHRGACAALDPRPEISLTTNAIGLAAACPGARRRRARPHQRVARLAARRDVRDAHPSPVPRQGARRHRRRRGRGAHPDQDQRGAAARRQRPRGAPTCSPGRSTGGHQLRFIEQMPLDADQDLAPRRHVTADDIRGRLAERFVLEPARRPARRCARRAVRRGRPRRGGPPRRHRRHHRVGQRAVLRRLPSHPPHRRGRRAQLPLLATPRPTCSRPAARRGERRRARRPLARRHVGEAGLRTASTATTSSSPSAP